MSNRKRFPGMIEKAAIENDFNLVGMCVTDYQCRQLDDASQALIVATKNNNFRIVELLLKEQANKNERDDETDSTPLHIAVQNNFGSIIDLLLEYKADVNAKDKNGDTPIVLAVKNKNFDVATRLEANGADTDGLNEKSKKNKRKTKIMKEDDRELEKAAASGNIGKVCEYIKEKKGDVNKALFTATEKDQYEIVKILLENEASVNQKSDYSDSTPLLLAVKNNYPSIAMLLIEYRSDVNARDKFKDSPLLFAIENKNVDLTRNLIAQGADINIIDSSGKTVLLLASEAVATLIPSLISKGLDVNAVDPRMNSNALHKVIKHMTTNVFDSGAINALNALLDAGCDTSCKTTDGVTPLMVAMTNDFSRFDFEPTEYNTYFREQMSSTFDKFLSKCNNLDEENNNGETALMWAAESGYLHHVKTLVEKGCSINKLSRNNWTALRFAVKSNEPGVVKYLLDNGADYEVIDNDGSSLFEEALFKYSKTIEVLFQYGYRVDFSLIEVDEFIDVIKDSKSPLDILETMYLHGCCTQSNILRCLIDPKLELGWGINYNTKKDWLSELCSKPRTLKSQCQIAIRHGLQKAKRLDKIYLLPVPSKIKQYLNNEIKDEIFIEEPEPALTEKEIQERKKDEFYKWAEQFEFF